MTKEGKRAYFFLQKYNSTLIYQQLCKKILGTTAKRGRQICSYMICLIHSKKYVSSRLEFGQDLLQECIYETKYLVTCWRQKCFKIFFFFFLFWKRRYAWLSKHHKFWSFKARRFTKDKTKVKKTNINDIKYQCQLKKLIKSKNSLL